jgi:superfamily II DNA or RNA helicase
MSIESLSLDSTITLSNASGSFRQVVIAANTYPNPKYFSARQQGRYTGNIPDCIYSYQETKDGLILPRGYLGELLNQFPALLGTMSDRRVTAPVAIPALQGITLRDYQQQAVKGASRYEQGIIQAVTGSGKTIMGLQLIHQRGQRSLIMVHTNELAKQWAAEIEKILGITSGMIGSGKWIEGEHITICMVQTLSRNPERTAELAAGYGLVLVDEAHHVPAETFARVIGQMPCKYRYGLTATPERRDGLHVLIHRAIGRTIAEVSADHVEDVGGIVPAEVTVIHTGFSPDCDSWQDYVSQLVSSDTRNAQIAQIATKASQQAPTLVLVDRIEHAHRIQELCQVTAVVAHGQLKKKIRVAAFEAMVTAPLTIGTTGLLGEGLDVSRWGTLILASPISSRVKLLQAIGRVIRPHPGKETGLVVDIVDDHGFSGSSFNKRKAIYDSRQYQVSFN